jgi:deoxyadenosine/deoxycytidine kinase
MHSPKTVCVTGNMASGKTTLTRLLSEHFPNACYVAEPHRENPFLPHYLLDQARWGFTAQLCYFRDYARFFAETVQPEHDYHFVDAGIWTNQMLYAHYLHDTEVMTDSEYNFYLALCEDIRLANHVPDASAFIFVTAPVEVCWQRLCKRGWDYQIAGVEVSYMETLHHYLEIMRETVAKQGIPYLEVSSVDMNFASAPDQEIVIAHVRQILGD